MSLRILVVDDEDHVRNLIQYSLQKEGYQIFTAKDGREALGKFEQGCEFVVLDVMLPDIDGFEILKQIRRVSKVPVIMLTAKAEEIDRILGLELGADDYLTKPFSPRELTARVKAILRRTSDQEVPGSAEVLQMGQLTINVSKRIVTIGSKEIALTYKEFEMLLLLAKYPGRVFSREELLERVWGYEYFGDTRTIDVHMRHLREKIESSPTAPQYLKTVRGVGYKFEINK